MEPDWSKPPFKKLKRTVFLHRWTVEAGFTVRTAASSRRSKTKEEGGDLISTMSGRLKTHLGPQTSSASGPNGHLHPPASCRSFLIICLIFGLFRSPYEAIIPLPQTQAFATPQGPTARTSLIKSSAPLKRRDALSPGGAISPSLEWWCQILAIISDVAGIWLGAAKRRRFVSSRGLPVHNSLPEQKAQSQPLIYRTQVLIPNVPHAPCEELKGEGLHFITFLFIYLFIYYDCCICTSGFFPRYNGFRLGWFPIPPLSFH